MSFPKAQHIFIIPYGKSDCDENECNMKLQTKKKRLNYQAHTPYIVCTAWLRF